MKGINLATAAASILALTSLCSASESNLTEPLTSRTILPNTFSPPPGFRNVNLLRNINLEKGYVRETINVVIENVASNAQDDYFIPFPSQVVDRIGGLEVRDKNDPDKKGFEVTLVEYDPYQTTQFYRIRLPAPLQPSAQQTLSISYPLLSSLQPLPASIEQSEKQYLVYAFSAYSPSAYPTLKQKTKLKFPTADITDYTSLPAKSNLEGKQDPQRQGTTFTYGPYGSIPAGAVAAVEVRYEFTRPLVHARLLERDLEISHWGGNLATEERYWLANVAAKLSKQFSRVTWAQTAYYNPSTTAVKELRIPLRAGTVDAYFTDDIGNVSTSRFRTGPRDANLDLKPRYPIFGGWRYNFRVGWNADLGASLRAVPREANSFVLKVPLIEGPKSPEGIEYEKVHVRIILPEGAIIKNYHLPDPGSFPLLSAETTLHKTFLDTKGRTTLSLTAVNLVDDPRDRSIIVTYHYPLSARLRKPLTITAGFFGLFVAAWLVGRVDVTIGGKRGVDVGKKKL
ncbi:MAG: dolichyl-diphosphooligosaccharide--protein glycosyltransferase subunit 1 [Peltula sp. TS41687]|nr:MAG: dolichyl-diphosphooligosaccharide--protein glycosyltransferase subunit 1 [Peltula sp. TS41687]